MRLSPIEVPPYITCYHWPCRTCVREVPICRDILQNVNQYAQLFELRGSFCYSGDDSICTVFERTLLRAAFLQTKGVAMNIDKKDFWILLIPVLAGFALPVLVVGAFGLHRNIHQENTFYSLFITFSSLMYVFYKTIYRKKFPEKFEEITRSFKHIASALFISCLSAATVATVISLIPAPAWFHIGLYVGAPLLVLYVFWKMGLKI